MAVNLHDLIDIDLLAYFKSKLDLLFAGKVDKETGKGLSTNDYTDADELKLSGIATGAQVNVIEGVQKNGASLTPTNKIVNITVPTKTSDITNDSGFITSSAVPGATSTTPKMDGTAAVGTETTYAKGDHVHPHDTTKVDKIDGKGLSTNDYTTAEKNKLAGIASGAEVNVQSDWNQTTTSADDYIKNKPSIPSKTSDITNDSGFITLSDLPEGVAPSTTTPVMDGTAATGSENAFARGDHVHPSDSTKVDKVNGKGLSTNDYTTAEQTKLAGIAAGAEVNVVTNASSSGSGAAETVTVSKGSTNYVMYSKNAIDQKLVGAMNYKGTKATTSALPSTGNAQGDVWHVTADGSEWAWNGSAWEELGTAVDLSGYVEEADLGLATTSDIDDLFT